MRAVAHRVRWLSQIDLRPQLAKIQCPVLLLGGDQDPLVPKTLEMELMQSLPNASRAEIEACGHFPHLTHPETLAEVIRQYLTPKRDACDHPAEAGPS